MSKTRFTKKEKILVLDEAIKLIKEPKSWIKGSWKCVVTKKRMGLSDGTGIQCYNMSYEPDLDSKGRVQYAYCLEGAINQGVVNVLGEKRALELGAIAINSKGTPYKESFSWGSDVWEWPSLEGGAATRIISVRDMLIAEGVIGSGEDDDAFGFNDDPKTTHKKVLDALRRKRRQLKAEIKAREARREKVLA